MSENSSIQYTLGYNDGFAEARKQFDKPSGEWLEIPVERDMLYNTGIAYTCSVCGRKNCYGKPPYCMYCGAKMEKKNE